MKKLFILAAAASLLFTGCTSDDEDTSLKDQQKKEISFATPVMYGMSRAGAVDGKYGSSYTPIVGEINGVYPTTENFMIYAKKYASSSTFSMTTWGTAKNVFGTITQATGDGTIDNEEVAYKVAGNGWFTQTAYYFLKDWKYAFAAYSPSKLDGFASGITYDNKGLHVAKYTSPADLSTHLDFMYAPRKVEITKDTPLGHTGNGNTTYDGVNMVFKHALSSVHFRAFVDPDYIKQEKAIYGNTVASGAFKIKSIKIQTVRGSGKFDEGITAQTSNSDYAATPKWTFAPGNATADYTFLDATGAAGGYVPVYVGDSDGAEGTTSQTLAADPKRDIKVLYDGSANSSSGVTVKGQYGLMIPQVFKLEPMGSGDVDAPGAQVVIAWSHTFKNGSQNNAGGKELTETYETTINLSDYSLKWELGKRYIYNIIFKGNLIEFAPTVEDWVDESKDIVVE